MSSEQLLLVLCKIFPFPILHCEMAKISLWPYLVNVWTLNMVPDFCMGTSNFIFRFMDGPPILYLVLTYKFDWRPFENSLKQRGRPGGHGRDGDNSTPAVGTDANARWANYWSRMMTMIMMMAMVMIIMMVMIMKMQKIEMYNIYVPGGPNPLQKPPVFIECGSANSFELSPRFANLSIRGSRVRT